MDTDKQAGSNEARVKRAKPSYALPDTHTAIIPLKFYFCSKNFNAYATTFEFTTNTLWDPINSSFQADTNNPADRQWYRGLINESDVRYSIQDNMENLASEQFWYRDYFSQFYKHYHVMSTEISLTVQNKGTAGIQVGILQYSDETAPPVLTKTDGYGITIPVFDSWKRTKRFYIGPGYSQAGDSSTRIRNFHMGRKTIHETVTNGSAPTEALELHDVVNNKVQSEMWTQVTNTPLHREYLKIYFWNDPLQHWDNSGAVNFELNMKCLVQFRDLKKFLEYPTGAFSQYSSDANNQGEIKLTGASGLNLTGFGAPTAV